MKLGVVGLGAMGAGIAQLSVEAGLDVVGCEVSPELAQRARDRVARQLDRKVEKGQLDQASRDGALGRLHVVSSLGDLAACDVVIEAIVEELEPKQQLFRELEHLCQPGVVLATNTSALSVSEIAAATAAPGNVVGMHFFNPAPLMPLVEVVRGEQTADETVERVFALAERMGKTPIRCHDTPGFVVNRVLIPALNDCVRVLDEANVSPEDLDTAMKNGAGWPMGPCELLDLIGIDVQVHASAAQHARQPDPRMLAPSRLVAMVEEGRLGRKSGSGFYEYDRQSAFSPSRASAAGPGP